MKTPTARSATWLAWITLCALSLIACDPFEKQRTEQAERTRIECLDKFCEGDTEPKRNMATEVALKLNGRWYIGPKEYFSGKSGAVFYWPSKTPEIGLPSGQSYPERGKPFYDVAIEIFLGAPRQPTPGKSMYQTLLEMESKGLVLEKRTLRDGLQMWRTREEGRLPETWYIATSLKEPGGDPPTIACRGNDPSYYRCNTGFRWLPDVAANMRFRAVHGPDWPEIYLETERVLKLLKKA